MKEYFVIHYYNSQTGYSTDPTLYSSEEEAHKHVKKDTYSMVERRVFSNSDLLQQIFGALCNRTNCKKCPIAPNCYCANPFDTFVFEELDEQTQLEVCATMARNWEEMGDDEE